MSEEAIKNALRIARAEGGSTRAPYGVVDLGDKIIVGAPHGEKIDLSDDLKKRVQDVAAKHGSWYEGTGGDIKPNKDIVKDYRGSWDDQYSKSVEGYPTEYLVPMFSNVDVNKPHEKFEDPERSILESLVANQEKMKYFKDRRYDEKVLRDFLRQGSQDDVDFESMAQMPATKKNLRKFFTTGERLTWPDNWQEYPNKLGKIAKKVEDQRNQFLLDAPPGVYVTGAGHIPELKSMRKGLSVIGGERAGYADGGEVANALRLARQNNNPVRFHHTIAREGYQDGGVPDEANQQAFLQEQLKGSAPQYVQEADFPARAAHAVETADRAAGTVNDLAAKAMYMDTMQSPKGRSAAEIVTAPIPPDPNEVSKQAIQQYQSGDRLGAAETMMAGMPQTGAIRAYHGGPHLFDKFDISKIGSGIGNQSKGRGLYFASDEGLARSYRDTLAEDYLRDAEIDALQALRASNWNKPKAHEYLNDRVSSYLKNKEILKEIPENISNYFSQKEEARHLIDEWAGLGRLPDGKAGHMYEVDINANPENLIDWDKSLDRQSEFVQKILRKRYPEHFLDNKSGELKGSDIVRPVKTGRERFESDISSAKNLKDLGIPGVVYSENGTPNYVIFDDNLIDILRRYADGGAVHDALRLARNKYATDGAVTPQASTEEPEAQAYGEVSFAPEYTPRPQEEVRQPDDAKQEAFIREELKGSAPQYDPTAETRLKNAAVAGAKWTAPGAAADAMGMLGGPSLAENVRQGRYLPAAMQVAAVGLPAAMAGRAAIASGLGAGASKFTKLGKPDVFMMPGYVAQQTADDWAPGLIGKESYEGAKMAGKKALEEGMNYIRRKVGYADGGEVHDALRLALAARDSEDRLPMRFSYGPRHGSTDLKDIGFRGPLKQPDGSVVSEYSSDRDIQYPSVYKGITDRDLATVMAHERMSAPKYKGEDEMSERLNASQPRIPFPEDVDDRAYAAARQRVEAGRSPFYEPGKDPYPQWSPEQNWEAPVVRSHGGEVHDALRLARSRLATGGQPAAPAAAQPMTGVMGGPAAGPTVNAGQPVQQPARPSLSSILSRGRTPTPAPTPAPAPIPTPIAPASPTTQSSSGLKSLLARLGRPATPSAPSTGVMGGPSAGPTVNAGSPVQPTPVVAPPSTPATGIMGGPTSGPTINAGQPVQPAPVTAPSGPTGIMGGPAAGQTVNAGQQTPAPSNDWKSMWPQAKLAPPMDVFQEVGQRNNFDPMALARYAYIESKFNPDAKNKFGYKGMFQFGDKAMKDLAAHGKPLKNPMDPTQAAQAAVDYMNINKGYIQKALTKTNTEFEPWMGYMAHQQGGEGFSKLLMNPNKPAWQQVGASAILNNGGKLSDTSAQFMNRWKENFNSAGVGPNTSSNAVAQGEPPAKPPTPSPTPSPEPQGSPSPIPNVAGSGSGSAFITPGSASGVGGFSPSPAPSPSPSPAPAPAPAPVPVPSTPHAIPTHTTPVHQAPVHHTPAPAPVHHSPAPVHHSTPTHTTPSHSNNFNIDYAPPGYVPYNHLTPHGAGGGLSTHGSKEHGGQAYYDPWSDPNHAYGQTTLFGNTGGVMSKARLVDDALRVARQSGGRTPAWQRSAGKNPEGGLNAKGRASAKAEGHDLKPPAPHPKTEKDAGRRKSFCARSAGQAKMFPKAAKDPDSRLNKARRAWNCADGGAVEDAVELAKRKTGGKAIWNKPRPKDLGGSKPLTSSQKASAKATAQSAGRKYPNMIDNIRASRKD